MERQKIKLRKIANKIKQIAIADKQENEVDCKIVKSFLLLFTYLDEGASISY